MDDVLGSSTPTSSPASRYPPVEADLSPIRRPWYLEYLSLERSVLPSVTPARSELSLSIKNIINIVKRVE